MSLKDRLEKWLNYAVSAAIYEGMDDDGLAELRQVRLALERYVLVHESHVRETTVLGDSEPSVSATIDVGIRRFIAPGMLGSARFEVVQHEKKSCRTRLLRYLEQPESPAPSLEQTPPDQP